MRIVTATILILTLGWAVANAQVRTGTTCSTTCDAYGHCSTYCF